MTLIAPVILRRQ